jgi:hypothetical protein
VDEPPAAAGRGAALDGGRTPTTAESVFPWDHATVTVKQRSTKALAGGALRLTLDDITAGQVLLTLTGADEQSIIDTRSVAEGQPIPFTFSGNGFVLVIDRLTNLLVGDDFAEISIYAAHAWAKASVDALIESVGKSDCKFVRNEQELSGDQFATLLRAKLDYSAEPLTSVDQFIEDFATESSTTGKPYEVRCPGGNAVPAAQWLRQQRQKPPCATRRDKPQPMLANDGDR